MQEAQGALLHGQGFAGLVAVQQLRRLLDLMDGGLYRIEMIVKRLLSLSKHQVVQLAPTPVDEVIREARTFVDAKVAKHHVEIVTELPPERVYALAARQQLEQALINLMLNALDSLPDGGRLVLRVSPPDPHRGTLTITVCDSGAGMTPEQREHIFEPFFSTKTSYGGTGLGLAVVLRIVEAHQGRIEVESAPGQGSTFMLELPSATPQALAAVPEPVPVPAGVPPQEMPDAG